MAPSALISLGILTLVFTVWAGAMFHMLWRLNQRSLDRLDETGGGYPTWFGHSVRIFLGAVTSEEDRRMRRRLLILTGLLIVSIAVHSFVASRI